MLRRSRAVKISSMDLSFIAASPVGGVGVCRGKTLVGFAAGGKSERADGEFLGETRYGLGGNAGGGVAGLCVFESSELDGEIADGGAFDRAEKDLQSGAGRGEAIEKMILAAAADDEEAAKLFASDLLNGREDFGVAGGEAVEDEIRDFGDGRGVGSAEWRDAGVLKLRVDFVNGIAREHEFGFVDVDELFRGGQSGARMDKLL